MRVRGKNGHLVVNPLTDSHFIPRCIFSQPSMLMVQGRMSKLAMLVKLASAQANRLAALRSGREAAQGQRTYADMMAVAFPARAHKTAAKAREARMSLRM